MSLKLCRVRLTRNLQYNLIRVAKKHHIQVLNAPSFPSKIPFISQHVVLELWQTVVAPTNMTLKKSYTKQISICPLPPSAVQIYKSGNPLRGVGNVFDSCENE